MRATSCPGCGLVATSPTVTMHAYIGASAGCWELFCDALISDLGASGRGHLLGDAYAAQHPGLPERRAVQSVGVHLVALCAALERGWPRSDMVELRRRAAMSCSQMWRWLEPELPLGTLTVADVVRSPDPAERAPQVWAYVEDVWNAYVDHHDEVRRWTDAVGTARAV